MEPKSKSLYSRTAILISEATKLRKNGKVFAAISMVQAALGDPTLTDSESALRVVLGTCFKTLKDISGAKEQFLQALERDPANTYALTELGQCYLQQHQTRNAKKYFGNVLDVPNSKNHIYALVGLGMCYLEENDPVKAASYFQRAIDIAPENIYASRGLERCYQRQQEAPPPPRRRPANSFAAAVSPPPPPEPIIKEPATKIPWIDQLKAHIATAPRNIGRYEQLIQALIKEERFDEARDYARQALRLDTRNATAKNCLHNYPDVTTHPHPPKGLSQPFSGATSPEAAAAAPIPTPRPSKDDWIPMDEVRMRILVNGVMVTAVFFVPPSNEPLRVEFINPALPDGEKGFVVARKRGRQPIGPA